MKWTVKTPAIAVAERANDNETELAPEVLRLSEHAAAIVIEIEGVDYVLTLQRAPEQRARKAVH